MKVVGYRAVSEQQVRILFDRLEITYPDMWRLTKDQKFIEIARKYNLTSWSLKHPDVINDSLAELFEDKNGDFGELVHSIAQFRRGIIVNKQYLGAAKEVFHLITGQNLKLLCEEYDRSCK